MAYNRIRSRICAVRIAMSRLPPYDCFAVSTICCKSALSGISTPNNRTMPAAKPAIPADQRAQGTAELRADERAARRRLRDADLTAAPESVHRQDRAASQHCAALHPADALGVRELRHVARLVHAPTLKDSGDYISTSESGGSSSPIQSSHEHECRPFLSFAELAIGFSQAPSCHLRTTGAAGNQTQSWRGAECRWRLHANEACTYRGHGAGSLPSGGMPVRGSRSKSRGCAAIKRRGSGSNRGAAGRRVPEFRQLGWQRHLSRRRRHSGGRGSCLVCQRARLCPLDRHRAGPSGRIGSDPAAGVLDRAGYWRCFVGCNHDGGRVAPRLFPFARHLSRSLAMNLINDGIGLLLGLAPVAALVALVLAGLALRNQGSVLQNGRFGQWIFWAAVMLTLPQILSWFSGFGMNVPVSAGGGTAFLNVFKVDVTNFVNQFLVGYFAPVVAAWLVLRAVVDISEGGPPLSSILGAMFLLSIASTQALLQGWNSGTKFATADVLAGLWTYTASRILPVAAGLAIIGAILNFAFGKPAIRLVCCAAGFLTVSALWRLVVSMM